MEGTSPLGLDYDYLQQLDKELDDLMKDESIYKDNDEIIDEFFSGFDKLELITHHVVISVACVILFITIPLTTAALFRHVFMTKAASFIVSASLRIWAEFMPLTEEKAKFNFQLNGRVQHNDINSQYNIPPIIPLSHGYVVLIGDAFQMHNDIASLILLYEVFQCTAKMGKREYKISTFLKYQSVAFVTIFATFALEQLALLIQDEWWRTVIEYIMPLQLILILITSSLIFFFGNRVLSALEASRLFQNDSSTAASSDVGKHRHLTLTIYVMLLGQLIKIVIRVLVMIILSVKFNSLHRCIDEAKETSDINDLESCGKPDGFPYIDFGGIFEIVGVVAIFVHRKCEKKNS